VVFRNSDQIRHHVYSFASIRRFEMVQAPGEISAPVRFDQPGSVAIGCNIHDHMLAYIYVVDTPWFAKTGASGTASVDDVPAGDYDLQIWHYALAAPQPAQLLHVTADKATAAFTVPLRAASLRAAPAH